MSKESDVELYSSGRLGIFEFQSGSALNQSSPAQNSWYALIGTCSTAGAVLTSIENARIYEIGVNIEDANETLEVQAVVDGVTIAASSKAATHSTAYWVMLNNSPIGRTLELALGTSRASKSHLFDGKAVCIMVRKTTATGSGNLTGLVTYGVLKDAR